MGFGSVVKHSTDDPGNASAIPALQLKLLKGDMNWFFPEKKLPCITGHVEEYAWRVVVPIKYNVHVYYNTLSVCILKSVCPILSLITIM